MSYQYAPAGIETGNGESILVYYNKDCVSGAPDVGFSPYSAACVNLVYDLNGLEGPNRIGKDMGTITAYFKSDPVVVAPMPITSNASDGSAPSYVDDDNNAAGLRKKKNQDSRLPDREELAALIYNSSLYGTDRNTNYWSGTTISPGRGGTAWGINQWGSILSATRSENKNVRCIKK